jgi:hypothetical protein
MVLYQTKNLLSSKWKTKRMKKTYNMRENILSCISDKGLISRIYKKQIKLNSKTHKL